MRELQDKCCLLERSKLSLEKECISLQAALETERREHSQGSETITDLMGGWHTQYLIRAWKDSCNVCKQWSSVCINKQKGTTSDLIFKSDLLVYLVNFISLFIDRAMRPA